MKLQIYRTYKFRKDEKDPVIDKIRTVLEDEGVTPSEAHVLSGVATATLSNWFDGPTKKPQFTTIAAVITSLGYDVEFSKKKRLNKGAELEVGRAWLAKREAEKEKEKPKRKRKAAAQ